MPRKSNKRAVNRRARQKKSPNGNRFSRQKNQSIVFPVYAPIYNFKRVQQDTQYNLVCDGINPTLAGISFRLSFIPNYAEFTALFDVYRITKINIKWNPEYTVLSDAAPVSTALNVFMNSVIDLTDAGPPPSVDDILQYSTIRTTGITKEHGRSWEPTTMMTEGMPCRCWLATSSPSTLHYGVKVAIPPTGTAMTFRATITYYVQFASSK